jgi:hypothetical protein
MIGRTTKVLILAVTVLAVAVALPGVLKAGSVASAGSPARVSVSVPSGAKSAGVVMLEIGIAAKRPASGHLGAVVRLRAGGGAVELGRISVTGNGEQRYQLNAAQALRSISGGSAEVEVELVDRGGGGPMASGAELSVGEARFVLR